MINKGVEINVEQLVTPEEVVGHLVVLDEVDFNVPQKPCRLPRFGCAVAFQCPKPCPERGQV